MRTFYKYLLIQIPGWALGALVVYWIWKWSWINVSWAVALIFIWILKDFMIYPLVRIGYETQTKTVVEQLIGHGGTAKEVLDPGGFVEVGPELWRAEIQPGEKPIPSKSPVRIVGARGRTLIVVPARPPEKEIRAGNPPHHR